MFSNSYKYMGNLSEMIKKFKDYLWLLAIILAVLLPTIKEKLGISTLEKDYETVNAQLKEAVNSKQEVIDTLNKQLKETKCNNVLLLKSVIRLQNEMALSNEMIFMQMKVNSMELSSARNRIENVRIGILEDIKNYSKANDCVF